MLPMDGALLRTVEFSHPRPAAHPKTKLTLPVGPPDVDNLGRGALDPLTQTRVEAPSRREQVTDTVWPMQTKRLGALSAPALAMLVLAGCAAAAPEPAYDDEVACSLALGVITRIGETFVDRDPGSDSLDAVVEARVLATELGDIPASRELSSALEELSDAWIGAVDAMEEGLRTGDLTAYDEVALGLDAPGETVTAMCGT